MKLFVLVQPGGYCDEARVIGVFDSFDRAKEERIWSFGAEIKEVELNVPERMEQREVKSDGSTSMDAFKAEALRLIAGTNPYAKLLQNNPYERIEMP